MNKTYLIAALGLLAVALVVWQPAEQVPQADPGAPALAAGEAAGGPPRHPPEHYIIAFFKAVEARDVDEAADLIARRTLTIGERQMRRDLNFFAASFEYDDWPAHAREPVTVLDVHTDGEYAIAVARFFHSEANEDQPVIRPVVLVQERGAWRIDWRLLGQDPERAEAVSPLAPRIGGLYRWYELREDELEREIVASAGGTGPAG